jgi:hypothetical protein
VAVSTSIFLVSIIPLVVESSSCLLLPSPVSSQPCGVLASRLLVPMANGSVALVDLEKAVVSRIVLTGALKCFVTSASCLVVVLEEHSKTVLLDATTTLVGEASPPLCENTPPNETLCFEDVVVVSQGPDSLVGFKGTTTYTRLANTKITRVCSTMLLDSRGFVYSLFPLKRLKRFLPWPAACICELAAVSRSGVLVALERESARETRQRQEVLLTEQTNAADALVHQAARALAVRWGEGHAGTAVMHQHAQLMGCQGRWHTTTELVAPQTVLPSRHTRSAITKIGDSSCVILLSQDEEVVHEGSGDGGGKTEMITTEVRASGLDVVLQRVKEGDTARDVLAAVLGSGTWTLLASPAPFAATAQGEEARSVTVEFEANGRFRVRVVAPGIVAAAVLREMVTRKLQGLGAREEEETSNKRARWQRALLDARDDLGDVELVARAWMARYCKEDD